MLECVGNFLINLQCKCIQGADGRQDRFLALVWVLQEMNVSVSIFEAWSITKHEAEPDEEKYTTCMGTQNCGLVSGDHK